MSNDREAYIAGKRTSADWYALRDTLSVGVPAGWNKAFTEFFEARLALRYLHPIKVLQDYGSSEGEGFSIVAIQCSLIEFLESTTQGKNYRYVRRPEDLGAYEYSSSQSVFVSFLRDQAPFSGTFNEAAAKDFYASVRCGLLHEARTKNGWRIQAKSSQGEIASPANRIVYRNNFQDALLMYIQSYGAKLPHEKPLQEAFIRKFNGLCT